MNNTETTNSISTVNETAEATPMKNHDLTVSPLARIFEGTNGYEIRLDMPGAQEKTIQIGIENNLLSIDAIREDTPFENGEIIREEFPIADYHTAYKVPDRVDTEAISAKFTNGVLTLVLPKRAESKMRKISVTAA